ncbi:riboflavin synthase [Mycena pura]|uniref:Riboflavin synthase n=1 Tax=Mycena pura TaxID=153505 RepID=A0AAD6Y0C8_9AGAR|nr:riboflavin synthase [Mycena pura]
MFTGLIEHMGTVSAVRLDEAGCTLTISDSAAILGDCHIGDSIAVNGACLTVTEFDAQSHGGWFTVWLANETLERTDLGERKVGDQVNLERAMGAHVRFGGHFVQAHVDTTATIVHRSPDGDSLRLTFELPAPTESRPSLLQYLIPKGYVTIDGASLTLTGVDDARRQFSVMLIQHTQEKITVGRKAIGAKVNVEVDMIAKYIEKSVVAAVAGSGDSGLRRAVENIVESVLAKKGIIVTVRVTESSPQKSYASRSPSPLKSNPSPFRPKAKVNSSATSSLVARKATSAVSSSAVSRTASVKSAASTVSKTSTTPRSASPTRNASVPRPRAVVTRGLTARVDPQGARRQSLTNDTAQPYTSRNVASSPATTVSDMLGLSDDEPYIPGGSPRITAKLSRAKLNSDDIPSSLTLPPSRRGQLHRPRVPSMSSTASSSSSPFYATAATTSAGSPHLYPSPRPSPPSSAKPQYQPFPRDNIGAKYARTNGFPKVDPATVPLPPNSPPMSAVSFSSRSSLSHSSASYAAESENSQLNVTLPGKERDATDANVRGGLENLLGFSGMLEPAESAVDDSDGDADGDRDERAEQLRASATARQIRAEAKSMRKIADLEITNRSLLAINTSLEQTKHRQTKEIRDLRRKLRESRLILPPRDYRAMRSSIGDEDDTDEDEEDGEEAEKALEDHDVTYRRIKVILEGLLGAGRHALETTSTDFPEPVNVTKVLSAYEIPDFDDKEPHEESSSQRPTSPSRVAVPDNSDEEEFRSEDEVEAMTLPRGSPSPTPPTPSPPQRIEIER